MDDLIDRQAAIDAVWGVSKAVPTMAIRARQALRELPPAEPEISCSEIPNSSELISRQAAINVIAKWMLEYGGYGEEHGIYALKQAAEEIKALPSAQPERKNGKWERHYCEDGNPDGWRCDKCDEWYYFGQTLPNFCPNCGARMQEGEENG